MRILITGGFGFVGGRVARCLQQAGHHIILGSRHTRKAPECLPQAKVAQITWNDEMALEKICSGVDVVIHAAGMNAQDCAADQVAALEFNGVATTRLLVAAIRAGTQRFIYLSTAHVYASPLVGIISEDTCPRNLHPYATSHLAGESAVLFATQRGQIEGIVLRLSNAFGAPVHKDVSCWMLLVNDLCRQAVGTGKLVLHSSGMQYRDFVAMNDVSRSIETMISREIVPGEAAVFNVGSGISRTVLEVAQLIQQRCKLVLGFEPGLQKMETGSDEVHEKLDFRVERLLSKCSTVGVSDVNEIDTLLLFCNTSFYVPK